MRRPALTLAGAVALGLCGAARAARAQSSATTASAVLSIPATARILALGGAYTAVVGDEGSVFVNPAGMAAIRHVALGMSYEPYVLGSYLASGAAAARVGRFHLAAGVHMLDFGQDTVFRPDPASGGETGLPDPGGAMVGAYSAEAVGAAAYRFGMFSIGASAKYLKDHLSIPDTTLYDASGFGFDVGGALAFFDIAAIGVVVQNLGADLATNTGTPAPLPRTVRAGFALNFLDPQGTTRLMVVGDWVSPREERSYWAFGVEGGVVARGVGVLGRLGIASGRAPTDQRSLVFGGGLVFGGLRLDYSYQGFASLGAGSSRFGISWVP
jgi:hypothetical protein